MYMYIHVSATDVILSTDLPGSEDSSSRSLFFRSPSLGCPVAVADDDTTPKPVLAVVGRDAVAAEAIAVAGAMLVVVVGEVLFDETDIAVETTGIAEAIVVVDTVAPMETATVLPEASVVAEEEMGMAVTEVTAVVDSEGAIGGVETTGAVEATEVTGSEEAIAVTGRAGVAELVEVIEATVVAATTSKAGEAVLVLTTDIIGVTTCGEVVRTNTAATGA